MNRREFIMGATAIVGASELGFAAGQTFRKITIAKTDYDRMMKPFANGKFDLNVNLAEFGLKFM